MPNCSRFESQVVEVIRLGPYFAIAGAAFTPIISRIEATNRIVSQAKTQVIPRKPASQPISKRLGGREIELPVGITSNGCDIVPLEACASVLSVFKDRPFTA